MPYTLKPLVVDQPDGKAPVDGKTTTSSYLIKIFI